jgi:DNA helicase IV
MRGHLLVEGAPGSGKTTVALQRIPYLLDQQYEELDLKRDNPHFTPEGTVVFVFSEVLEQYLDLLLRQLHIHSVRIEPTRRFLRTEVRRRDLTRNASQAGKASVHLVLLKSRIEILNLLQQSALATISRRLPEVVAKLQSKVEEVLPRRTWGNAAQAELLQPVLDLDRAATNHRLRIAAVLAEVGEVLASWRERKPGPDVPDREVQEEMRRATDRELSALADPLTLLNAFVASDEAEKLLEAAVTLTGTASRQSFRDALDLWRVALAERRLNDEDFVLLAWLSHWTTGGSKAARRMPRWSLPWPEFTHVVVDEAQDLTEVELRFLIDLVDPRFRCVTAVGDLAQRINWPAGLDSWERAGLRVDGEEGKRGVFKVNYRQTFELGRLAYEFHREAFAREPLFDPNAQRRGPMPEVHIVPKEGRFETAAASIERMLDRGAGRTIAVLIEDESEQNRAHRALHERLFGITECQISSGAELKRRGLVHITPISEVKGLEFDCVVFLPADHSLGLNDSSPSDPSALNRAYVAITRACDELVLVASGASPLLQRLRHVVRVIDS